MRTKGCTGVVRAGIEAGGGAGVEAKLNIGKAQLSIEACPNT